ncbi:MAG: ParB N-terminal domain-containing protein [Sphingopyxis sp.]|nr:ParB N-terminal domain-containing protein [Sphingopyxis sp.]
MMPRKGLKPNPTNARKHDDKQLAQIAASIERFGFLVPIIIDDDDMIAAGHGRWEAAGRLGIEAVPTIRARFLTDADRRAFALAENRIAELSSWDEDLLANELSILFDGGYDLEITGFSTADLDFSLPEEVVKDKAEEIELPDLDVRPVSCEGDLWRIGPHRLYCGNARSVESYETLLGGDRADMVFSDPPYNVPSDGHVSGLGKHRHREFAEASGELTAAEFTAFLRTIFRNCVRFAANGSIHYHCMDWRHIREMLDAADGVYSGFKQLVVWKKQNAGMGTFYRSQHELLFVFKSGTAKHTNNFRLGQTGRYRTNVWEHAGANSFRKGRDRDLAAHATIKPTALVADAILDCSNRGDLILDPFSGSGTTLIAAHKTRRRGAAIELDPLHCDTSIRRLMAASGLDAIREDGARFADLEADLAIGEAVDHG